MSYSPTLVYAVQNRRRTWGVGGLGRYGGFGAFGDDSSGGDSGFTPVDPTPAPDPASSAAGTPAGSSWDWSQIGKFVGGVVTSIVPGSGGRLTLQAGGPGAPALVNGPGYASQPYTKPAPNYTTPLLIGAGVLVYFLLKK